MSTARLARSTTDVDESDGNAGFLRAARDGNLEDVVQFLRGGIDINTSNPNGLNALHLATKEGHIKVVTELLRRGANVEAATKKGNTSLHIASLAGHEEIVKKLVDSGAQVNLQAQAGFTPLYMASQEGHADVVKYLLANGSNQGLSTEDGFTPLAVALQQCHDKVVTVLLEHDAKGKLKLPALHIAAKKDDVKSAALLLQNEQNSVELQTKSGFTPLHIASHYGNINVANLLIQRSADVNFRAKNNITPLHVGSRWGKLNMVKLLIDSNANIDEKTRDGLTPLHCAARSGHETIVDTLLERGASHSAKTKNGLTPLHMAAQGDHEDCARLLLYHKASLNEVTVDYLTPLHVAAHCGNVKTAKLLLDRKCEPNARALNGFTPLHIACKKNRIKVVELLLKYGASIESKTESGLTPLHVASFMGHMNIVIYLIQHNANPNTTTVRGETSLHLAARANQSDIIRILLRNGATVDARAREQQTPLHIAARLGNVDNVVLLLQHGAVVDAATKDKYTPLHIAAKEGHDEVAQVLLEHEAQHDVTTKKGFTPLHIASKYGNIQVASLLLQKGANPNVQGKNGLTPLHVATHYNHADVAQLLLESKANPHATAKNGYTPLHIAAKKNQMDIATMLLEYGAKPNSESKNGFTPLHLASQEGHTDIVSLLLEKDANVNCQAQNGLTPMHLAAQEDRVPVAEILCKYGSNTDTSTKAGYTPLHTACHFGQVNMVRFLLSNDASVNATTKVGYTPLHQAAQQGHVQVVSLLLKNQASPNAVTNNGQTPLAIAQKLGYVSVVDILKPVTDVHAITLATEDKYKVVSPEIMQETFISDSEDEGGSSNAGSVMLLYGSLTTSTFGGDDSISLERGGSTSPLDMSFDKEVKLRYPATDSKGRQISQLGATMNYPSYLENGPDYEEEMRYYHGDTLSPKDKNSSPDKSRTDSVFYSGDYSTLGSNRDSLTLESTRDHSTGGSVADIYVGDDEDLKYVADDPYLRKQPEQQVTEDMFARQSFRLSEGPSEVFTPRGWSGQESLDRANIVYQAQTSASAGKVLSAEPEVTASITFNPLFTTPSKETKLTPRDDPDTIRAVYQGASLKSPSVKDDIPSENWDTAHVSYHLNSPESPTVYQQNYPEGWDNVDASDKVNYPDSPTIIEYLPEHYEAVNASYELKSPTSPTANVQLFQEDLQALDTSNEIIYPDSPTLVEKLPERYDAVHASYQLQSPASPTANVQILPENLDTFDASYNIKSPDSPTIIEQTLPERWDTADIAYEDRYSSPITTEQDSPTRWDIPKIVYQGQYSHSISDQNSDSVTFLPDDSVEIVRPTISDKDEDYMDAQITSQSFHTMLTAAPPTSGRLLVGADTHRTSYSGSSFSTSFDPDNVPVDRSPVNSGFLISFMVDARGGAMRGCRHPGVRIIIPPRKCCMPTRITCRLVKREKLIKPPPMLEGEGLAARVLEMSPVGVKFLGPVLLEVPHFASLRGNEREVVILRSDNGESWYEHPMQATEDAVTEALGSSPEGGLRGSQASVSSLWQLDSEEDLSKKRIKRILTTDLPQYFALVSRVTHVKQESIVIGMEGGVLSSNVVPQVQAVLPEGTLTRPIPVGLQAQPIAPELVAKLLGNRVAVSPIVTIEPRRRKFHKPITLTIPVPRAAQKGMINQYGGDRPTLRLLFSLAADPNPAVWEDVTDSKPMTLVDDCVSFTTTVSARFWLIDCQNVSEASQMASILYQEAVTVPYMAKFVVFAKRDSPEEGKLRIFCMTDDKDDKTLEKQEKFFEVARSRDIEVLEGRPQFVEMAGNLIPVTKSGDQLHVNFRAFRENRLPCTVKIRDQDQEASARVAFMKEPKVARGEAPQTPICNLNIRLPDFTMSDSVELDADKAAEISKRHDFLRDRGLVIQDSVHRAEMKLSDVADTLQGDWVLLAQQLQFSMSEVNHIKNEHKIVGDQALAMLYLWVQKNPDRVTDNQLENALRKINRDDVVRKCVFNTAVVDDEVEAATARADIAAQSGYNSTSEEKVTTNKDSLKRDTSRDVQYNQEVIKVSKSVTEESPTSRRKGHALEEIRYYGPDGSYDEEPVSTTDSSIAEAATRLATSSAADDDDQYDSDGRDIGVSHQHGQQGVERGVMYSRAQIVSQEVVHSYQGTHNVTSQPSSQIVSPLSEDGRSYIEEPSSVPEPTLPEGFKADELAFDKTEDDDENSEYGKVKYEDAIDESYDFRPVVDSLGDISSDADTYRTANQSLEGRLDQSRYSDINVDTYDYSHQLEDDIESWQEQTLKTEHDYPDNAEQLDSSVTPDDSYTVVDHEQGYPGEEGYPDIHYSYQTENADTLEEKYDLIGDHLKTGNIQSDEVDGLLRTKPGDTVLSLVSENVGSSVDYLGSPVDPVDHLQDYQEHSSVAVPSYDSNLLRENGSDFVITDAPDTPGTRRQLTAELGNESFLDRREETLLTEKQTLSAEDFAYRHAVFQTLSHIISTSTVDSLGDTAPAADESILGDESTEGGSLVKDAEAEYDAQIGSSVDFNVVTAEVPLKEQLEVHDNEETLPDGTVHHTRTVRSHSFMKIEQNATYEHGVEGKVEEQELVPKLEKEDVVETFYEPPRMVRQTDNIEHVSEDGVKVQRKIISSRMVQSTRTHQEYFHASSGRQIEDFEISEIIPGTVSAFVDGSDSSDSDWTDDEYFEGEEDEEKTGLIDDGAIATNQPLTADLSKATSSRSGSIEETQEHAQIEEQAVTPRSRSPAGSSDNNLSGSQQINVTTSSSRVEEGTLEYSRTSGIQGDLNSKDGIHTHVYRQQHEAGTSSKEFSSISDDTHNFSLDTDDGLTEHQEWRELSGTGYPERRVTRVNYSSDDLNTSGAESYCSSIQSDDDVQSHRLVMKKEVHKRTLFGAGGQEETSVFEDSQVQQDNEPPEELRESMEEIIKQFMDMPPHPIKISANDSQEDDV